MIDSVVKKGILHRSMPQDYAVAVDLGTAKRPFPFIAVADGCSAGRHSEIGAIILCRAAMAEAKRWLLDYDGDTPYSLGEVIQNNMTSALISRTKYTIKQLDLELDDMIATIRIMYVLDGVIYNYSQGDGYDFFIAPDTTVQFDEYYYRSNAPYYPAYTMFNKVAEYANIASNSFILNKDTTAKMDDISGVVYDKLSPTTIIMSSRPIGDLLFVGVASDGLDSYTKGDQGLVAKKVLHQLAQIKNPVGEFLVRRFQKMDRELESEGFINQDDISIACINLDCYRSTLEANK